MTGELIIIVLLLACNIILAYKIYKLESKPDKASNIVECLFNDITIKELSRVIDNQAALLECICTYLAERGFNMPTEEQIAKMVDRYRQT